MRERHLYRAVYHYREEGVRDLARRLKRPDGPALRAAAEAMAPFLPAGALLIPIPDRWGDPGANLALCRELAERTGLSVAPVLTRRTPVESSRERRQDGRGSVPPQEQAMMLVPSGAERVARWPGPVIFVDNVAVTGCTIRAARLAAGRGRGLVLAWDRAPDPGRPGPGGGKERPLTFRGGGPA